ncbi:phosphatidate cytidylyltransferase [Pinibacter aurantiacus]|uniref:Phosphatidate cytidylyltransferase n=1 Tax=Pinibacter aurantiacus TaxID=2851599 RepID=A0A9E2S861_9BACT|nr:phosphatidate cytidylyltransferase [Pinibacter aurantiacus]MBV4357387.1 phosphatidate cytidylyltransferase [Pinibacter aurantiacus]
MAFNWQTFKTRTLTAVLFVAVMLTGLLWNYWSFFILFSIIHFGCWIEYQKLIELIDGEYKNINPFHKYATIIAGWCLMLFATNEYFHIGGFSLHAIGWWVGLIALFILPISELLFTKNINLKNIGYSFLGLLYISLSLAAMIDIRNPLKFDLQWITPLIIICSIWINDTMAYIVGSLIGKTPFSKISPKKTWEGTIGGMLLAVITVTLVGRAVGASSTVQLIGISSIAAIMGTLGDLLESKLKRMANVKDSGSIMPGHGGFLDRFDSLLVATPFVWLFLKLLNA